MLTYEELCLRVLGMTGYAWVVASVIIGCIGSIIAFFIIAGDMITPVIRAACTGSTGTDAAICAVVSHRAFSVGSFAVLVALPFASCENVHSLGGSSLVAAGSILGIVALAVARGATALTSGVTQCVSAAGVAVALPTEGLLDDSRLWVGSGWRVALGLPLVVFALGNHVQAVPLFLELGRENSEERAAAKGAPAGGGSHVWRTDAANPQLRLPWVVAAVMALCAGLYSAIGALGLLACGPATQGDFLLSFPAGDAFADVARAGMAVHVALAVPVCVVPCRRAIVLLTFFLLEWQRRKGCTPQGRILPRRESAAWESGADVETPDSSAPLLEGLDAPLQQLLQQQQVVQGAPPGVYGSVTSAPTAAAAADPHAALLRAYALHEESGLQCCGMGCGSTTLLLNLVIVGGSAAVAVAFPQVQVRKESRLVVVCPSCHLHHDLSIPPHNLLVAGCLWPFRGDRLDVANLCYSRVAAMGACC